LSSSDPKAASPHQLFDPFLYSTKEITMPDLPENANSPMTRRASFAATAGALFAAGALPALADQKKHGDDAEVLYGHGVVWNRDLPGLDGQVNLSFDLRVNLETGLGSGTAHDPVHPDYNIHFTIGSAQRDKVHGGESLFTLTGVVTDAVNPDSIGLPVRILAETKGDATAIAVAIGDKAFAGAGLVVIAIIAILIGLLLPAVQKVNL
jgi:hypothetical protein